MKNLIIFYIGLIIVVISLSYSIATITNLVAPVPHSINTVRSLHVSLEEASTAKLLAETEKIEAEAATIQTERIIHSTNEATWMIAKFIGITLFAIFGLVLFVKFINILRNQENGK